MAERLPAKAVTPGPASAAAAAAEPSLRLFFALWPDDAMRAGLVRATQEAVERSGGRPVPAQNLHVTLAFLGSVPERRLPELAAVARRAAGEFRGEGASPIHEQPGVTLVFEHLEHWRAAHILCAAPARPPPTAPSPAPLPVAALARRLQERLTEGGFAADEGTPRSAGSNIAQPFRPHVTLARRAPRAPRSMAMEAVTWSFADFVLVASRTHAEGAAYRVLESFNVGIG